MVVTSKTSPIVLSKQKRPRGRASSQEEKVFIGTRVTRLRTDGDFRYDVDILQYSKSSEGGFVSPKVIGKRDSGNPNKITWNDNAPDIVKKSWNNDNIIKTVKDQMRSMEKDFVQSSQNIEDYRRENGFRNFGDDLISSNPLTENGGGSQDNNKTSTSAFTYPIDLSTNNQDVLKFVIRERKARQLTAGVQSDRVQGKSHTTIYLPITGQATDTMSVSYENGTLNFLEAAALETIRTALTDDKDNAVGGVGGVLGGLIDSMSGVNNEEIQKVIGSAGAAAALRAFGSNVTATQVFSRQEGKALNPNLELLFKSPELRNFSFQYKFSPRSAPEAKAVKSIIKAFKKAMAPKRGNEGSFFLQAPDIFELTYLNKNMIHSSMNKFKTCALKSCTVNYAPEGTYATFPDGVMHSYVMSLGFTEIDPVFAEDYDEKPLTGNDLPGFLFADTLAEMSNSQEISNIGF
tara:strand:- start:925 stop:2307 length:1383 start_codon:yes stop_codon:yes gene_type:complete